MKKLKFISLTVFSLLFVIEVFLRVLGHNMYHFPLLNLNESVYNYYPELKKLPLAKAKGVCRVCILGGSTVTDNLCGLTASVKAFGDSSFTTLECINLSAFAQNTLDCKYKYHLIKDASIDYLFIYNGINDTRANNCPVDVFDNDYRHVEFYNELYVLNRHPEKSVYATPFYIDFIINKWLFFTGVKKAIPKQYLVLNESMMEPYQLRQKDSVGTEGWKVYNFIQAHKNKIVGEHTEPVDSSWLQAGENIKTAGPFRENVIDILAECRKKQCKLILSDFAFYQPEDYSLKKFLNKELDYNEQKWPTENYGMPTNVVKGIEVHNRIIDSIVAGNSDILYFSLNDSLPKSRLYFNDICHFSPTGCASLSSILGNLIVKDYTRLQQK